ncbi:MAG TPA: thymidine kinase [Oligoflexia bacterium]|nr:thymidine kinase [Oligoflexia bacterium]
MVNAIPRGAGWIEVVCGSMFSGKTEELIRRLKRAQIARVKVQCFKPVIDDRYSKDHVMSHDATRISSIQIDRPWQILEQLGDNTRVIGIDEIQFFDDSIVEVAQKLANRGVRVILAGLDQDYLGQPFGPMPRLLAIAEDVTKLSAICVQCGAPAHRTQRLVSRAEQIAVGSKDMYEARCRICHDPSLGAESAQGTLNLAGPSHSAS